MDINWPDGIDIADTAVTLPMDRLLKISNALTLAQEDRAMSEKRVITLEGEKRALTERITLLTNQEKGLAQRITDLEKALAEATKPPVVTPPAPPPTIPNPIPRIPVINKTQISGMAALTIAKDMGEPDDGMYADVRSIMAKAKSMGFNAWRGFFNIDEVRKHLRRTAIDVNHLPAQGRMLGLQFIADSIGTALVELDSAGAREYLKGLEAMGAVAVVFDDANDEKTSDLESWAGIVRMVLPNMPIIASLTGVANIGQYPMFDFFEAQTFGNTDELKMFLGRPFDIFCLDARKDISAAGITTRAAIVLPAKPKALFYYVDRMEDWLNMPLDKQSAIRKMIESWKATR